MSELFLIWFLFIELSQVYNKYIFKRLLSLASDKVEHEDVMLSCCETAGYVRFALFTSGYGYSPPSATLA